MSWALSCHSFRKFYDDVELYTDAAGKALLIDTLQLPYTKVYVCMDRLNHLPPLLWAAPKIYTYSLQTTPFIHADGDVYIWKKFDAALEQSPLLAQSIETNWAYYNDILDTLQQDGYCLPPALANIDRQNDALQTLNVGIFGGTDLRFIQSYSRDMLRFYLHNVVQLSSNKVGKLNPLDQFYLHHKALTEQVPVSLLFTDEKQDFSELMLFNLVPQYHTYIHLLGAAKKNPLYCQMVALHLQQEFPVYYQTMQHLFERPSTINTFNTPPSFISSFNNSLVLLSAIGVAPLPNSSEALSEALQHSTALLQTPHLHTLAQHIFAHENAYYQLGLHSTSLPNETERLPGFIKAKKLLAATSPTDKSAFLQQPFVLSPTARITALEYDVPAIISQPNWHQHTQMLLEQTEAGQHIFLYVKQDNGMVMLYPLGDTNQLLYYFANNPFTGQELVQVLLEDEDNPQDEAMRNYYTDVVFYFLTNNVILTGYLVFSEESFTG